MNGFNKCENGHFFKEDLSKCPYCPGGEAQSNQNTQAVDLSKTIVGGVGNSTSGGDASTQVFGGQGASSDKTKVFGNKSAGNNQQQDFSRTFIGGMDSSSSNEDGKSVEATPRSTRRIVGWIISYTLDAMGVDYRIYEGNNSIGREPGNSIIVAKDTTISSKHANILYKTGKFWIRDEMAANGTFLNGEELEIGKAYELNDSDLIKISNTIFRFKSAE